MTAEVLAIKEEPVSVKGGVLLSIWNSMIESAKDSYIEQKHPGTSRTKGSKTRINIEDGLETLSFG